MDVISVAQAAEAVEGFGLRDAYLVAGAAIAMLLGLSGYLFVRWLDSQRDLREAKEQALARDIEEAHDAAEDALGRAERFHSEVTGELRMLESRIADCVHKDDLQAMRSEVGNKLDQLSDSIDRGLQRVYDKLDTKQDKD